MSTQVKRDAQRADEMIAALARNRAEAEAATSQEDDTQEDVDTTAQDQEQLADSDQGVQQEQESEAGEDETAGDTQEQPESDDSNLMQRLEKMEQRYKSLQGMVSAKDRQINQLHELLAGMQQQSRQQPAKDEDTTSTAAALVSKEDEDAFGADMVDFTRRVAREEFQRLSVQFKNEVDSLRQELSGVTKVAQTSGQHTFESKLTAEYKRWEEIDRDPEFIEWLQGRPAWTQTFHSAVKSLDVVSTADVYRAFAQFKDAQQRTVEQPAQNRRKELERQVAPGKTRAVAAPSKATSEQKTWTRSEIAAVYANKRAYKADEFAKLEREIADAQRTGRVDYTK